MFQGRRVIFLRGRLVVINHAATSVLILYSAKSCVQVEVRFIKAPLIFTRAPVGRGQVTISLTV